MRLWAVVGAVALLGGCGGTGEIGSTQAATSLPTPGSAMLARPHVGDAAAQPGEQLILNQDLFNIQYGALALTPSFSYGLVPVHTSQVRVELSGAQCGATVQQVNISSQPNQVLLQPMIAYGNGVYATSAADIYQIQLELYQVSFYPAANCNLKIYAPLGGTDGGSPADGGTGNDGGSSNGGTDVLAGWVNYVGGFVPRVDVPVTTTAKVVSFRVATPSFCTVDISKADVVTSQAVQPTELTDATNHVYSVNAGNGAVVSAVTLTLNGPTTSSCQIPVFITTAE